MSLDRNGVRVSLKDQKSADAQQLVDTYHFPKETEKAKISSKVRDSGEPFLGLHFRNFKTSVTESSSARRRGMAISDAVVANLTTIYLVAIAAIKAYGLATGRSFSGGFVLVTSTAAVVLILIGTLAWDVSRKATYALSRDHVHEMCRGGICWHGVAVKSSASQVRFRLPQQPPNLRP
ncbi:hypothetical protein AAG906_018091 [Vitis piasezkii]|uniref:Uncharacterized protein n=1 Tax=Vitis vinifera TaxID=29760 RepID=A0A438E4B8_VITVI|nr:hypothetical protein CK203_087804 [Vitis vinifera]